MYHTCIFPYLIYCVEIWGNAADIYLLPLIKLQKKIVLAITFSKYLAHRAELFVNLDILHFKLLVVHRIGILIFKNYLGYVPNVVHNLFTTNASIRDYNTRNKHKLRAVYGKHNFMHNNFRFVGTQIWNYIIDHLDIKVYLPKFKKYSRHTFTQTIITFSYDNIIEANYFTTFSILVILFVLIISLIDIINLSILQQIISSFPDKYVTLSLIFSFQLLQ